MDREKELFKHFQQLYPDGFIFFRPGTKRYQCSVCFEEFDHIPEAEEHIRSHRYSKKSLAKPTEKPLAKRPSVWSNEI